MLNNNQNGEDFDEFDRKIEDYRDYFQIDKTDHFIFGKIKIFQQWNNRENLLFRKIHFNKTKEEYQQDILEIQERIKINHPNLLNLMNYSSIPPDSKHPYYQINIIYDYPSQFFKPNYAYKMFKKEKFSSYLILCLGFDILNAIHFLKKNKKYHGDIRPRYIAVSSDQKSQFILCDRLKHTEDAFTLQLNNLKKKDRKLYISPNVLKALVTGNKEYLGSEYKNEMFSLGLLMLEIGCLRSIQDIYNLQTGDFNNDKFIQHVNFMNSRYSYDKILMKFMTQLLTLNQEKMPSAKEMLLQIQRQKGKMNEKVKMGLDDFERIYDRHDDDYEFMNKTGTEQNPDFHRQDFAPIQQITKLDINESLMPITKLQGNQIKVNNYQSQRNQEAFKQSQPYQNQDQFYYSQTKRYGNRIENPNVRSHSRIIQSKISNNTKRSVSAKKMPNYAYQGEQPKVVTVYKQGQYHKYKAK